MKKNKLIQKIVKQEGKYSLVSKTVVKYKNSKEFNYLIDVTKI